MYQGRTTNDPCINLEVCDNIHTDLSPIGGSPYFNVTYIVHNQPPNVFHGHPYNMTYPDEQRLMNYILKGYEKSVRPVRNASTAVKIKMGLTMTQIFDMDEKNQVLVTNVWLDQEWMDEFLRWPPTEFNNITTLRIPCDKIWLPDIVLYNNAAEYTDGLMSANAMVKPNGEVFWPVPAKLQSSCKVDVTYFPFDEQRCKLKFGSWTYDGFQVDILNRTSEVDLDNYVINGEWELLSITIQRNVVYYQCCPEPFPDVTFYIHIRRRTLYYMYNVVFPCIMMSALTLLVFCLPPDSGEKIALGITVLLAFSVFMLAVAENLPETSEFVPLISVYLTIVMSLTSISVIMTVLVLNLHHRGPNRQEIPLWMRRIVLGKLRQFFCINNSSSSLVTTNETKFLRSMSLKMTLDNIAQELQNEMQMENGMADTIVTDNQGTSIHSPRDVRFNSLQNENLKRSRTKSNRGHSYSRINDEILQSLRSVIDKHEREDHDYEITQDWRRVAQVVDRILFWVFFFGTLISTIIVLVICPTFR
ncbi:CHRNN [Mytilus edulis]|uniref:CHRNN n=1 Tax=Mytilus edulis TaxID=6550 RepID=A0A8S3U810_MYTED|nr:CHRNN [Mytilus edulis]